MKKATFVYSKTGKFWDEIKLRAENNYGNWNNKEEAEEKVKTAINEVMDDQKQMMIDTEKFDEIVKEMTEVN